jgi:MoxR-like ATPase
MADVADEEHFAVEGPFTTGKTPIGRATTARLAMNEPERVQVRAELQQAGDL